MRPAFHQEEAERDRLQRLSLRQPLTGSQADRLAYLDFLAGNRGFALYRASASRRALAVALGRTPDDHDSIGIAA